METPYLFKMTFDTVEELDAFVNYFSLVRGIEFRWNRVDRTAWLYCEKGLYHELQAACPPSCEPVQEAKPCPW